MTPSEGPKSEVARHLPCERQKTTTTRGERHRVEAIAYVRGTMGMSYALSKV